MSDTSVKSCGPINCQLETAKKFLKLRKVISFCGLPTCKEDSQWEESCKSPFELNQFLEYCRPANCVGFWDAHSETVSKKSYNPSWRASRTLPSSNNRSILIDIHSSSQIFNSPECEIPKCPKKTKINKDSDSDTQSHDEEIPINLCGPPNCCSDIDIVSTVDFNFACDLESRECKKLTAKDNLLGLRNNRNGIYYCVSPSVYKDIQQSNKEVQRYATVETVISAHLMKNHRDSCQSNSKKKPAPDCAAPMHRRATFPDNLIDDISETEEIESSFHTFRSNTTLDSVGRRVVKSSPSPDSRSRASDLDSSKANGSNYFKYRLKSLTKSQDFPQTPSPSSTIVDRKISSITPFQKFPLSPQRITSTEENIVKTYLSASSNILMTPTIAAKESVQVTTRNPSEVQAILKTVYSISSADFPPTPVAKDVGQSSEYKLNYKDVETALHKQSENPRESQETNDLMKGKCDGPVTSSLCPSSKGTMQETYPSQPTCFPSTCDKLLGSKKWKPCCKSPLCPINDPTTSTYNFLLKVRMCCGKRKCQLAAKICDIYEPLVQVEPDLAEVGDPQYHYLASDAATDALEVLEIISPTTSSTQVTLLDVAGVSSLGSHLPSNELEESEPELANLLPESSIAGSRNGSSDSVNDQPDKGTSRRTSTVSWSVPRDTGEPSSSQEQIVSRATAEADKFRQTPVVLRRVSAFGEIAGKTVDDPTELEEQFTKQEKFKSQLSNIQSNDSGHNTKCCYSLKEKFKRKKKIKSLDVTNDSNISWRMSSDIHEKRKTNISTIPVQEKSQQISNMLNKMY